jgi:uncharacterized protein (TIGR02594 family)
MPSENLQELQALLVRQGFKLGSSGPQNNGVDGDWGPQTATAFESFVSVHAAATVRVPPAMQAAGALHIPGLRPEYAWVAALGDTLPRTAWCGLQLYGTLELAGAANSPTILGWAAEVGLRAAYTADAVPWCGLYAAVVAKRALKELPPNPLWALNWAAFGEPVGQPGLGDVLTFQREGGGHVGFYLGEDPVAYHVLGGNQGDAVSIARIQKSRLYHARRPVYSALPPTVRPYILAPTGALSTNES